MYEQFSHFCLLEGMKTCFNRVSLILTRDPFDMLFQFLYNGLLQLIDHHVCIIKNTSCTYKIYFILSFWDGIYFIMSVLT